MSYLTNEERASNLYENSGTPTYPEDVTFDTPLENLNLNWAEKDLPESLRTKHVNLIMVRYGYAWKYDQYSDSRRLEKAEQRARKKRRGLWKQDDPIPPWEWRD